MAMASENNNLSNITLSSGTLIPNFAPNTLLYSATVDADIVTINYQKSDRRAKVLCNPDCNNINLNYGNNKIDIKVTAESGTVKTYTINITRPDNRDSNNNLSSLSLSQGKINFNSGTTTYNVTVDKDVDKIKITSSLESFKATYVDWSNTKEVSLKYGVNTFNITVKAENESTKTYKLNITRPDGRDADNSLSNITISSGNLTFDPNVLEYTVNVTNDVEKVTIDYKTKSKKSKAEILGPDTLQIGENVYEIKVTAENESVKTYRITVIRNEEDVKLSNVALLEELTISGYDISFDPNKFEYEINSDQVEFIINAKAKDGGNYYVLNNGSVDAKGRIIVRVTAADGTTKDYIIKVNPLTKNSKVNLLLVIILVIVIALLLVGAIYFIIIRKKKKDDNNVNNNNQLNNDPYSSFENNK